MAFKIGRRFGAAMGLDVIFRGKQANWRVADQLRNDGFVLNFPDVDAQINALLDEVRPAVLQDQVDIELRMRLKDFGKARHDLQPCEAGLAGKPQRA